VFSKATTPPDPATGSVVSHDLGTQTAIQGSSAAEQQVITAKLARETAVDQLKRATRVVRYRRLRLLAGRRGMPGWACGLMTGSAAAIVSTIILIMACGAGLPLIFLGLLLAYAAVGGSVLWFFRDFSGEYDGNRVLVRTEQVRLAEEYRLAVIEVLKEKTAVENKAKQILHSIQERLQSDAHKRQLETERLLSIDPGRLYPDEFERHVAEIFKHLGFSVEVTGHSRDQGVDVLACKGPMRFAIQAKRYLGPVGNAAIQEVYAGMAYHKCHRCAVVTNSDFTSSALALAQSTGCLLIGADKIGPLIRGEIAF
jgi:HJR/Mrr/RecB family endonuclease